LPFLSIQQSLNVTHTKAQPLAEIQRMEANPLAESPISQGARFYSEQPRDFFSCSKFFGRHAAHIATQHRQLSFNVKEKVARI
jgi:hypothetical protein